MISLLCAMLKKLKQKTVTRKRVNLESAELELFEDAMTRKTRKVADQHRADQTQFDQTQSDFAIIRRAAEPPQQPKQVSSAPRYLGALLEQKKIRDAERRHALITMQRKQAAGLVAFESDTYKAMVGLEESGTVSTPGPATSARVGPETNFASKVLALDLLRARERYFARANKRRAT